MDEIASSKRKGMAKSRMSMSKKSLKSEAEPEEPQFVALPFEKHEVTETERFLRDKKER